MQKYLAKLLRADELFRAEATISETRDGPFHLKGEEDFVLLLRESIEEEANSGRRWREACGTV